MAMLQGKHLQQGAPDWPAGHCRATSSSAVVVQTTRQDKHNNLWPQPDLFEFGQVLSSQEL